MTAARLRAMTGGQLFATSPVVIEDESGRRYEVIGRRVECEGKADEQGVTKPAGVPVLTLVLKEVG